MDHRKPLSEGSILCFENKQYIIQKEIGRGSSCIVYDARYETNNFDEKIIRIKEFFPYNQAVERVNDCLIPNNKDLFMSEMKRFIQSFSSSNEMYKNLPNKVDNKLDIYDSNNTKYILSVYDHGDILTFNPNRSLKDCCSIVYKIARIIREIHKCGYLYLDLKPSNVFVLRDMDNNVRFFDFDCLYPINTHEGEEYVLSYSLDFAPYELIKGDMNAIGTQTDIFEIGSLLFYLLFERAPSYFDCNPNRNIDFTNSIIKPSKYNNKAIDLLNDIFHNTLSVSYKNRYDSVDLLVDKLSELIIVSSPEAKFIVSSKIHHNPYFVGRKKEIDMIESWYDNSYENCLFISGIPGIGKTETVKEFIYQNLTKFDNVVFLKERKTIVDTINDDYSFMIHGLSKYDGKTEIEYYKEKVKTLSSLSENEKTIIVIDDFDELIDENVLLLLNANAKFILISDKKTNNKYPCIHIEELSDISDQVKLFKCYLKKDIDNEKTVKEICNIVDGHTMMIVCLASQIISSHLTVDELYKTITNNNVFSTFTEKITVDQDDAQKYNTISNLFLELFRISNLDKKEYSILKGLLLFDGYGVNPHEFEIFFGSPCIDSINNLIRKGLIICDSNTLSLHPIIRDLANSRKWGEKEIDLIMQIIKTLYTLIHTNSYKFPLPKPIFKKYFKMKNEISRNPELKDFFVKLVQKNKSIENEVMLARILTDFSPGNIDNSILNRFVYVSSFVIENSKNIQEIASTEYFKSLDYDTIYNQPRYNDNYILNNYSRILEDSSINEKMKINLLDYVVFIYLKRKDFENANRLIEYAEKKFGKRADNYVRARIYQMRAMICNHFSLFGIESYTKLDYYSNECIKYTKRKSKYKYASKFLLATELSEKCIIMVRTRKCNKANFFKTIKAAEKVAKKYCLEVSEAWMTIKNAYAFYYTYVEKDLDKAIGYMIESQNIANQIYFCSLDLIDNSIIPIAMMMFELGKYELSEKYLNKGIRICEKHADYAAYKLKKEELEFHLDNVIKAKRS